MVTLTPVDHDPFAAPAPPQVPGVGLVGRQTLGPNSPPQFMTAGATPAPAPRAPAAVSPLPGDGAAANNMPGPKLTPVDHDPFAGEAAAPVAPQPSAMGQLYRGEQERQAAAAQMTDQDARDPATGEFSRPVLGKAYELDDGNVYYDAADGHPVRADKNMHVVLRDPKTDQMMVFERTPETDQTDLKGRILSVGQMVAPGLVTGPVTAAMRGAGATARAGNLAAATAVEQDAAAFNRQGVRPFGPAFGSGPVAATAKQITEMPVVGGPVRGALTESLEGARDATRGVAATMGGARTEAEAGNVVARGIERFKDARPVDVVDDAVANLSDAELSAIVARPSRFSSLKTKMGALYERAWRHVDPDMRAGRSVRGDPRVMGSVQNTKAVLADIRGRNERMTVQSGEHPAPRNATAPVGGSGLLAEMLRALEHPHWTGNLQTLRDMRSEFRRLASGWSDTEKMVLKNSDIERIQSALTQDMIALLQRNMTAFREQALALNAAGNTAGADRAIAAARGFERAIPAFQRADRYTRLSMERLETIERLFKAESAESLARNIKTAAMAGGKGNEALLTTLARTLRPEELREVSAMVLHNMGTPSAGAKGETARIGWSVMQAMTNMRNTSPRARALLFGGEWAQAFDDLERINTRLANVEALSNSSRTLSNTMGIGSIAAGAAAAFSGGVGAVAAALGTAGTLAVSSVLFSQPAYVRWVINWTRLKATMRNPQQMGALTTSLNQLGRMAKADPQLLPVYRALAAENGVAPNTEGAEDKKQ